MNYRHLLFLVPLILLMTNGLQFAYADGPADNQPESVREIPPKGITLEPEARQALLWRCKAIRTQWQSIGSKLKGQENTAELARLKTLEPEVLVFPRAVELAIEFDQFYRPQDLQSASNLLDEATQRIIRISNGADWPEVVGLDSETGTRSIIGGYKSEIDDSFQPYGLVVPANFHRSSETPRRLDLWFHGRGEKVAEIHFLTQQKASTGQYTPANTFVLHPYGRYCNAFKFAGEVDVLEALNYLRNRIPVDSRLVSVRGFSMGGAGCWQFATHYPDLWFAANPGAGFSETPEFLRIFQDEDVRVTATKYEQTLWNLYDCPPWSRNLLSCPTVAYSGEIDKQKQAADLMADSLEQHGLRLAHIIAPDTAHSIHPDSKNVIEQKMRSLAEHRLENTLPRRLDFTTYTLKYNKHHWISIIGLEQHWKESYVRANVEGSIIFATTQNISEIEFEFEPGQSLMDQSGPVTVNIDGQILEGPLPESDQSWHWSLTRRNGSWSATNRGSDDLSKSPNLQGPIDDAFMQRFIFVLPSGSSSDKHVNEWITQESNHAMTHWKKHFRGDIRRVRDEELTEADIAESNLILFGDIDSNSVIRQISDQLPLIWNDETIQIGHHQVNRQGHVPVMIYPNPLNRSRYVVLNSGFTFREYDYLNNARQTPKLPDWALIDVTNGATSQTPGKVIHADFFGEDWLPLKSE